MNCITEEIPMSVNNFYACTIPLEGKPHQPEINKRISSALSRVREELEQLG